MNNIKKIILNNKGFTMVEFVIAMTVFVVMMSIAVGGFIGILRTQRIISALMSANDNMSLTLEQMAREIRTGYNFCSVSVSEFQFVNSNNEVIRYQLNNETLERGVSASSGGTTPDCTDGSDSWFAYKKITADDVKISNLNVEFCGENLDGTILGYCGGGQLSPLRITMSMAVSSNEPDVKKLGISNNIQVTLSAR